MDQKKSYDVIVVGAGHAGCEAALAAARLGARTLLLTFNLDHIAQMSCNPAIGGIAKGQVVREIDALGGAQGIVADAASIQFRMLNSAKGPAVWSPRAQCDKVCYQRGMKLTLEMAENLDIMQAEVTGFVFNDKLICGVTTHFGETISGKSIVLTTGTFLRGKLHYGMNHFAGGRAGDPSSDKLALELKTRLGLRIGRLKTGTPPRIMAKTIDFNRMQRQEADDFDEHFSFWASPSPLPRVQRRDLPCYQVYTNAKTAEIVNQNLDQAPLYRGKIEGIGTRYCPSFEDKVVRFSHHPQHLLYLEPEGEFTAEYYINGISTSLPIEVQVQMIHSIPGLEKAVISRYAYAIEYDFVFPDQLLRTLALKRWPNVFCAGQINGTSGYEEAGGQGLIAGLNAARMAAGLDGVEIARDTCYIGVMIDDLVTKDIIEPYRLFTSRAEYRLRLRQDNADLRLCDWAHQYGLLSENKYRQFTTYREKLITTENMSQKLKHNGKTIWEWVKQLKGAYCPGKPLPFPLHTGLSLDDTNALDQRILRQLAISAHYEGYLARESVAVSKLHKLEGWKIPPEFDYDIIIGLRNESRAKLKQVLPTTLAQAARIDGVMPPELALLQIHLNRHHSQCDKNLKK